MKKLLFVAAAMTASFIGKAQITLEHTFSEVSSLTTVLFTSNGTKHVVKDTGLNAIKLYNTDYTLWKTIPFTVPAGYRYAAVYLVSDKLFNDDNNIELVLIYSGIGSGADYKGVVINETGGVIFDLGSGYYTTTVYIDGAHKVIMNDIFNNRFRVYSVPGSLPCGHCGAGSVGVPKVGNASGGSVAAASVPNPGSDEVRISYSLPLGVNSGVLVLSGVDGKVINSYPVSNRDSELKVNISTLPGGMYLYTLHAEGMMPATGKIVK